MACLACILISLGRVAQGNGLQVWSYPAIRSWWWVCPTRTLRQVLTASMYLAMGLPCAVRRQVEALMNEHVQVDFVQNMMDVMGGVFTGGMCCAGCVAAVLTVRTCAGEMDTDRADDGGDGSSGQRKRNRPVRFAVVFHPRFHGHTQVC